MIAKDNIQIVVTGTETLSWHTADPNRRRMIPRPVVTAVCVVNGVTITSTTSKAQPVTEGDDAWTWAKERAARGAWEALYYEVRSNNVVDNTVSPGVVG